MNPAILLRDAPFLFPAHHRGVGIVPPVVIQRFPDKAHPLPVAEGLEPESVVLKRCPRGFMMPDPVPVQESFPVNPGPGIDGEEKRLLLLPRAQRPAVERIVRRQPYGLLPYRSVRAGREQDIVGFHEVQVVFSRFPVQPLEHPRIGVVVRFQDADIFPPGRLDPDVHRAAVAGVFLVDEMKAGIPFRVFLHDAQRSVRGSVVQEDKLHVFQRLRRKAVQRCGEIALHVHDRHDHGNRRRCVPIRPLAGVIPPRTVSPLSVLHS